MISEICHGMAGMDRVFNLPSMLQNYLDVSLEATKWVVSPTYKQGILGL